MRMVLSALLALVGVGMMGCSHISTQTSHAASEATARPSSLEKGRANAPAARGLAQGLPSPELGALTQQVDNYLTANGADPSDGDVAAALSQLTRLAARYQAQLSGEGSFTDLQYVNQVPNANWSPSTHFARLRTMALAYRAQGQTLYRNAELRSKIEAGIAFTNTFYGSTHCPFPVRTSSMNGAVSCGNWWQWEIGAPSDFAPTLFLMRSDLGSETLSNALATLSAHIGPAPLMTGANLMDLSMEHLYYALVTGDDARLGKVQAAVEGLCQVENGDGIRPDFSFSQHGKTSASGSYLGQLMTGAYGSVFSSDVSVYMLLTRGTRYALSADAAEVCVDFVSEGIRWSLYENYFDPSVIGRAVTRPTTNGGGGLVSLMRLAEIPSARKADLVSTAREMLASWKDVFSLEMSAIASSLRKSAEPAAWPVGFKVFPYADYVVFRGPGFFSSVKMLSNRNLSGELVNLEDKQGSRQSDGRFYLTLTGNEYYSNSVWPTLDWARLPGITVERKVGAADATYGSGTRAFVGAVGDGKNGVAAMDFAAVGSALTAKKSWFFLGKAIVFLTSAIDCPTSNHAETVIDQRPLPSASSPVIVDGKELSPSPGAVLLNPTWAYANGVGYLFLDGHSVRAQVESNSGTWASLGVGDSAVHTNPIFTLYEDHGPKADGASAAYAIAAGMGGADVVATWASSNPVTVLKNDATAAAVRDETAKLTGIIFWAPGTVAGIQSDTPAALLIRATGADLTLSVSDPAQGEGPMRISVSGNYHLISGAGAIAVEALGGRTTVTFPRTGGLTSQATLAPNS